MFDTRLKRTLAISSRDKVHDMPDGSNTVYAGNLWTNRDFECCIHDSITLVNTYSYWRSSSQILRYFKVLYATTLGT